MKRPALVRAAKYLRVDQLARKLSLEVYRVNDDAGCPYLSPPSDSMRERARSSFKNEFPLPSDGFSDEEERANKISSYHWKYPYRFGSQLVDSDNPTEAGIRGYHYKRYMHLFPALLSLTGGSLAGRRVLDVGCNSGFWSIQARLSGAEHVVGVDAGAGNIDQANFVRQFIGLDGVEYDIRNVYDLTADDPGKFDVVLFLGLLYHLDKPVFGLERLFEVTEEIAVVDTAMARTGLPVLRAGTDSIRPQSHTNQLQFFPSRSVIPKMLRHVGFREVYIVRPNEGLVPASYECKPAPSIVPRATFIALK